MQNTPRQFVATYGFILNQQGEVLIVKRAPHDTHPGLWEMPGGAVEWEEDPKDAVVREVAEEAGINVTAVRPLAVKSNVSQRGNHVIRIAFLCKISDFTQEVTLSEEHSDFKWISLDKLPDLHLSSLVRDIFLDKENLRLEE